MECYVTPRTLMAIIRLSIAHAKLRRSLKVETEDVEEALRLIEASREAIDTNVNKYRDKTKLIGQKIMAMLDSNGGELEEIHLRQNVCN
mmetsp:Transcript_29767/g.25077  ORF Transcript_29767/g.25077 Transcript_29767/m.25077 type:complete len:89 (+) Transcript_29767:1878-2144(+)